MDVIVGMIVAMDVAVFGKNTAHMMMMGLLGLSKIFFEADDLNAVFAKFAIHVGTARHGLQRPLFKDLQDIGMGIEIMGNKKFHGPKLLGRGRGVGANPFFEHAGKKKIGQNQDAFKTERYASA